MNLYKDKRLEKDFSTCIENQTEGNCKSETRVFMNMWACIVMNSIIDNHCLITKSAVCRTKNEEMRQQAEWLFLRLIYKTLGKEETVCICVGVNLFRTRVHAPAGQNRKLVSYFYSASTPNCQCFIFPPVEFNA